ncbi:MAG: Tim44 domain-containing protein, partial [Alphaproteobacteria bacterium]
PFGSRGADGGSEDKVIPLPDRARSGDGDGDEVATPNSPPRAATLGDGPEVGLTQIQLADKNFDKDHFLAGARAAFEMVLNAYAAGDTKALRPLLSNDVYENFAGAIAERAKAGHTLETTLVGITEAAIVDAELQNKTAFITVKFVSEQVNVVRDKDGNVVEGDPNQVTRITDIWTFARNTRSRDPNWTLVATQSPS